MYGIHYQQNVYASSVNVFNNRIDKDLGRATHRIRADNNFNSMSRLSVS